MNVVFLDFNGVLDTYDEMDEINSKNLKLLKNIVEAGNAKVVISSSLKNSFYYTGRLSNFMKYIIEELENIGIEVIGITPKADTREEEIELYLEEHPEVKNFCILDDDYEMKNLKNNLIKLPPQGPGQMGLTENYANMAIKILKK